MFPIVLRQFSGKFFEVKVLIPCRRLPFQFETNDLFFWGGEATPSELLYLYVHIPNNVSFSLNNVWVSGGDSPCTHVCTYMYVWHFHTHLFVFISDFHVCEFYVTVEKLQVNYK
jgi:hypothetical protein